jgi:hypothetical protein
MLLLLFLSNYSSPSKPLRHLPNTESQYITHNTTITPQASQLKPFKK